MLLQVPRVLVLGGTTEGIELAARLAARSDLVTISSLAGRVGQPRLPDGLVRIGGFGGLDGLLSYLEKEKIAVVIDATHPFAARISRNAEIACSRLGLPFVGLLRPAWTKSEKDIWHDVPDVLSAAQFVDKAEARVFLSIGRQELHIFSDCKDAWYLIRAIDAPAERLPLHHKIVLQRGPFDLERELQLLRDHSIDFVVSKNSGGAATYTKIEAARLLGIPVVMINRPAKHTLSSVASVEEAITALDDVLRLHWRD